MAAIARTFVTVKTSIALGEADGPKISNWRDPRIMVLLLMVAAITVAADPILVLGPALTRSFGDSAKWSGVFIAALSAGNVAGSLRPSRQHASIRRAASALCVLSVAMMIFVLAPVFWLSVAAALVAGMACLHAGATLKALLRLTFGKRLVRNIAFERAS